MNEFLSFDDVLIVPKFSIIKSRKDVNPYVAGLLPIISSNMDSVTGVEMANAIYNANAMACLHRFWSIEDNVNAFKQCHVRGPQPMVSVGLGDKELERTKALFDAGAATFIIDVAHGASMEVVNQAKKVKEMIGIGQHLIVGNFANKESIRDFCYRLGFNPAMVKVGIGGGSACTTRVVTGCGAPTLGSIIDCKRSGVSIIADGGIRNSGDFCKAIAAGADAVMLGGMLAGCDESPGELIKTNCAYSHQDPFVYTQHKRYRGSASKESYEVQGKVADHRTPEGKSFLVPYKGPVKNVIQELEAGLRSAMAYTNSTTLKEFQQNCEFIRITNNGVIENGAHGDKS